jgi:uncharacterized membrane protein YciS (DUF1049 family)
MKRLLAFIIVLTLLVLTGTLVSANGQSILSSHLQNCLEQTEASDGIR